MASYSKRYVPHPVSGDALPPLKAACWAASAHFLSLFGFGHLCPRSLLVRMTVTFVRPERRSGAYIMAAIALRSGKSSWEQEVQRRFAICVPYCCKRLISLLSQICLRDLQKDFQISRSARVVHWRSDFPHSTLCLVRLPPGRSPLLQPITSILLSSP